MGLMCLALVTPLSPAFAKLKPPKPRDGRGCIGISVRSGMTNKDRAATLGLGAKMDPSQVWFSRLDESIEAYAIDGLVWPYYSWIERTHFVMNSRRTSMSNWTRSPLTSRWNCYLLNAKPGRYVAIGANFIHANVLTARGKIYTAAFSSEMVSATEAVVREGEWVFMGEYFAEPRQVLDPVQAFYMSRLPLTMLSNWFLKNRRAAVGVRDIDRSSATEAAFWEQTRKTFRKTPEWLPSVPSQARADSTVRPASEKVSLLSQTAYRLFVKGDPEAVRMATQALETSEFTVGESHASVAAHLANLAFLRYEDGDYTRAEDLLSRSLEIRETALDPEHPAIALSLLSLADLYATRGRCEQALPLMQRAVRIREKTLGPDHPDLADALSRLAMCQVETEPRLAVPTMIRAVKIIEEHRQTDRPELGEMFNNLGVAYHRNGDRENALSLYERALAFRERAFGENSPDVAETLLNLAGLHHDAGEYAEAEAMITRSLHPHENAFGLQSPRVANVLTRLAQYRQHRGAPTDIVLDTFVRSGAIHDRSLEQVLARGSERQKIDYVASTGSHRISVVLTFHTQAAPADEGALRLAFETLLRWKGRALDTSARHLAALRRRLKPEDRKLLGDLSAQRRELASLAFVLPQGEQTREHMAQQIDADIRKLEAQLSERSADYRFSKTPPTLEAVQALIPEDAALVEFARFRPTRFEAKTSEPQYGPPRWVAYLLRSAGPPRWVDLGAASAIDGVATEVRLAVGSPDDPEAFREPARDLYRTILQPIRPFLGNAKHLLLSPDAALHVVPFAALIDEEGRFLVEDYTLTYLTSGRDVFRLQETSPSREGAWIFADPDFEAVLPATEEVDAETYDALQSRDLDEGLFVPLPGTREEAEAVHALLPSSTLQLGADATEAAIKERKGPRLLHIATHGFFLEDEGLPTPDLSVRGSHATDLLSPLPRRTADSGIENPLLRSGLVLAGAKTPGRQDEDGILTALEVAGLDLRGTKLVALSACETGLGELQNAEGVFGLRRALILAGAESQLMSLWSVSDLATRDLMVAYYGRLKDGEGRSEALRNVQLTLLTNEKHDHPFFWASFIQSGSWRSLDRKN
jgi:CHAT domain-containing protein/tetratricopeptide (TPR) repeat protein